MVEKLIRQRGQDITGHLNDAARAKLTAGGQLLGVAGQAVGKGDPLATEIGIQVFRRIQETAGVFLGLSGRVTREVEETISELREKRLLFVESDGTYDNMLVASTQKAMEEVLAVSRIKEALGNRESFVLPGEESDERFNKPVYELAIGGATKTSLVNERIKTVGDLLSHSVVELLNIKGISTPRLIELLFALYDEGFLPQEQTTQPIE